MSLEGKTLLVTGGTGSFGQAFIKWALNEAGVARIRVLSRDELKQAEMRERFPDKRLRFFVGDVRDKERVSMAMQDVDIVIHAAAMKRVEACEYNPFEAIQTNIIGTQNVMLEAISANVEKCLALSTDKAVSPLNLYGATKLCLEKIVLSGEAIKGAKCKTKFACVRYGNVLGSRGSIVPLFKEQAKTGVIKITDSRMTRFLITLPQAVEFVRQSLEAMKGGEVFIPKLPTAYVTDIAKAIAPEAKHEVIGLRPGEKLHEAMIALGEPVTENHFNYVVSQSGDTEVCYSSDEEKSKLSIPLIKKLLESIA